MSTTVSNPAILPEHRARLLTVASAEQVAALGKDAFAAFFTRRHAFCELGVLEALPTKGASREDFLRFVRVNHADAALVLKRFQWDEAGNLLALAQPYIPVRSQRIVDALGTEELSFSFVPRVLRKKTKGSPMKVEVITFDILWR